MVETADIILDDLHGAFGTRIVPASVLPSFDNVSMTPVIPSWTRGLHASLFWLLRHSIRHPGSRASCSVPSPWMTKLLPSRDG